MVSNKKHTLPAKANLLVLENQVGIFGSIVDVLINIVAFLSDLFSFLGDVND